MFSSNTNSMLFDEGFVRSASMILASEIGDKTFFIAAVMAMTHSRATVIREFGFQFTNALFCTSSLLCVFSLLKTRRTRTRSVLRSTSTDFFFRTHTTTQIYKQVWSGSVFALAVMTALSALLGAVAPNVLNKTTTHYIATGLFFLFGARSIYEQTIGYDANAESELEEVEKALSKKSSTSQRRRSTRQSSTKTSAAAAAKTTTKTTTPRGGGGGQNILSVVFSPIFLQAFLMTFLAEWGDRSQIATIALAADYDPLGVTIGGVCGHAACTSAAVLGGKRMAGAISERMVGLCGGVLFVAFGVHALIVGE